jgi:hypothetical protein
LIEANAGLTKVGPAANQMISHRMLSLNTKRFVARELLILVAIFLVAGITALGFYVRSTIAQDQIDQLGFELKAVRNKIEVLSPSSPPDENPFAQFGEDQDRTPHTYALYDSTNEALVRRTKEIDDLHTQRIILEARIRSIESRVMIESDIWRIGRSVALALLTIAYPLRVLILGTSWAIRVLRQPHED